jgi:hypothetical protein
MCHTEMKFEFIMPFLNHFYLTLNSWQPQQDGDGWKNQKIRWEVYLVDKHREYLDQPSSDDALMSVKASTGLFETAQALTVIFEPTGAPNISIFCKTVITIMFGFGDAYGKGCVLLFK